MTEAGEENPLIKNGEAAKREAGGRPQRPIASNGTADAQSMMMATMFSTSQQMIRNALQNGVKMNKVETFD